jgi:hypothetical protein
MSEKIDQPKPRQFTSAQGTVLNPDSIVVTGQHWSAPHAARVLAVYGECVSVQAPQNVAARGEWSI